MNMRQYALLARRWWWLFVGSVVVAGAGVYCYSSNQPPVYRATVTIRVDPSQGAEDPTYSDLMSSSFLVRTYAELIKKTPALESTIRKLHLSYQPKQLASRIQVRVIRDTQLLEASVVDGDPEQAESIANTLAETFISQLHDDQVGHAATSREVLEQAISDVERQLKESSQSLDRAKSAPTPDTGEITRLQSVLAQTQSTYSQLLKSDMEMRLTETQMLNGVKLAELAARPTVPISPRVMQDTLTAMLAGLILALIVVFLIEYLDDTVRSAEDVDRAVHWPTLGTIDRIAASRTNATYPRLLDEADVRSSVGECYRILRVNVDFAWAGQPGQTIALISANPREGKTTTLSNLALVFAKDNRRVIMVDADLRRPSLHRTFGVDRSHGLTNVLADPNVRLHACVVPTKQPNLWLLPSGPIPPNPSELVGSPRMLDLLQELRSRADLVLVDTPPWLVVSDAAIIAGRVDGVILVVEAGATRVQTLLRSKTTLLPTSARMLGVVLNKLSRRSSDNDRRYYDHCYGAPELSSSRANKGEPLVLPTGWCGEATRT